MLFYLGCLMEIFLGITIFIVPFLTHFPLIPKMNMIVDLIVLNNSTIVLVFKIHTHDFVRCPIVI
jgi:hypothetical protein